MKQTSVSFPCGSLSLEGLCYFPTGDGVFPGVVLCHPHPLYGGSMDNNVVLAVASALVERSLVALIFNFRGVGRSQGAFGNGMDEQQDVAAALTWLAAQPQVDNERLGLMGYSFGAAVALPAACDEQRVKALALVSLPLEPGQIPEMSTCTMPKLLVFGGRDIFVPREKVEGIKQTLAEPKQIHLVRDADHFWWGHETELARTVSQFFVENLSSGSPAP